jgi:hypothetical protein
LRLANSRPPETGALVSVRWPRARFEASGAREHPAVAQAA